MEKIKKYNSVILILLSVIFLVGAFIPYYNTEYKNALDSFITRQNEYYDYLQEAEDYKEQANSLRDEIAIASLSGNQSNYTKYTSEQNRLNRLSELSEEIASNHNAMYVRPASRHLNEVSERRNTTQIISGVISGLFFVGAIISFFVSKKKKKQNIESL